MPLPENHRITECNGRGCKYYRSDFMFQGCCHSLAWKACERKGKSSIRPIFGKPIKSPDWCPKRKIGKVVK